MDVLELLGGVFKALWATLSFVAQLSFVASPDFWKLIPTLLWAGGAFALASVAGAGAGVAATFAFAAFVAALFLTYFWEKGDKACGAALWIGALAGAGLIAVAIVRAGVSTQPAR